MSLRSLVLSSDEKTVRILRRVLSDLEIDMAHCSSLDAAVRGLSRQRYEAIILDCSNRDQTENVLKSAKASPVNNRALMIVIVDSSVGLGGGFSMGAHFVLHKPISGERARSSFRAIRALMKRERRRLVRLAVEVPVECRSLRTAVSYSARTIDVCEGGMAIRFTDKAVSESPLRFTLQLPGTAHKLEIEGEVAWEGSRAHAGVRFKALSAEQALDLRQFLNSQLPEVEQDDPPINCRLSDLSVGACYLESNWPFPAGTRVILSIRTDNFHVQASGVVRVMHPDHGMGVEFTQTTVDQREHVRQMIETLRSSDNQSPELQVEPDGLETVPATAPAAETEDALLDLFRNKADVPIEIFLTEMRQQRDLAGTK